MQINFRPKWLFILLALIVVIIQFSLLKSILKYGISSEDWLLLFNYKTIGPDRNFLDNLFASFYANGVYSTTYIFYIGILEGLFNGNYQAYQINNIIFKILATLSLYPLILVVFKRKSLAFFTTILYAISYSSAGALQFVVKGSDYLAIFFMNICLLTYYRSFISKRRFFLAVTTLLLFLAFIFSPIRMYPLLIFIFLVEVIIWVRLKGLSGLLTVLSRLLLLFLPFFMIWRFGPGSTGSYLTAPKTIYKIIFNDGNYQLLLTPFAGLGYTFLTNNYWPIFGSVTFDSFRDYLLFLARGPLFIYTLLTIAIGFLITKRPLFFILGIIFTNVVFELICYFFITNVRLAVGLNIKGFYPVSTNAIFFGFFCLSLAVSSLLIWLKNRKSNILLLSLFAGPIFSGVFLWGTWFIIGDSLTFKEGIHWYLIIPPIGSSLFLASLIILGFDRIKQVVNSYLRYVLIIYLFLIIIPIYIMSSKEISVYFNDLTNIGYGAADQEEMKNKLLSHLKYPLDGKSTLFYLDTSEDLQTPDLFYPVTIISGFEEKMHFQNWQVINGCVGLIYDKVTLEKSIVVKGGIKGFNAGGLCVYNYAAAGWVEMFFRTEEFYALKLKDKNAIDIKKDILKELRFNDR